MTKLLKSNGSNVNVGGVNYGPLDIFTAGKIVNDNIRVRWPKRILGTESIPSCDLDPDKTTENDIFKHF